MTVSLHQRRTHPLYVDDCFGCKAGSLLVSPAVELRVQSDGNYRTQRRITGSQGAADMAAYKRLRGHGLQPPHIDGCAFLERQADHPFEVTRGKLYRGERGKQLKEAMTMLDDGGFNATKAHTDPKPAPELVGSAA